MACIYDNQTTRNNIYSSAWRPVLALCTQTARSLTWRGLLKREDYIDFCEVTSPHMMTGSSSWRADIRKPTRWKVTVYFYQWFNVSHLHGKQNSIWIHDFVLHLHIALLHLGQFHLLRSLPKTNGKPTFRSIKFHSLHAPAACNITLQIYLVVCRQPARLHSLW
jgi:hypothetical protein